MRHVETLADPTMTFGHGGGLLLAGCAVLPAIILKYSLWGSQHQHFTFIIQWGCTLGAMKRFKFYV